MIRRFLSLLTILALAAAPASADPLKPLVVKGGQTRQLPAGDTVQTNASTAGAASINVPQGVAPSSPNNGDCWTTASGYFCRINGVTVNATHWLSNGTGAVLRTKDSKLGDAINVVDFGAVCNGSTNDATAISNALGYAASIGSGVVELPATGLCKVSSTITVPANVTLRGRGGLTSGLVAGVTNLNPMVALGGNYSSIERMYIDAGTAGVNTSGLVILTNNITSPIIRDLRIDRSCGAIQVNGILADVSNVYVFNSEGTSCSVIQIGNATTLSGTVNAKFDHVQVTSVNTSNRPAFCWDIKDAGGLFITHSDAIYCDVGTIIRPSTNQQVIWATFDNTYLGDTNGSRGFVIDPASSTGVVKGISCNACWASSAQTGDGIVIANSNAGTVDTINFTGLRALGNAGNAITLSTTARVSIADSHLCGYGLTGVFADTGVSQFRLSNTMIRPNCAGVTSSGQYGILMAGTNADISLDNLDVQGNAVANVAGTPTGNSYVSRIISITNGFLSKASAATVNLDAVADKWGITGTTTVTTLNNVWTGRQVILLPTTGTITFNTGGNICNAVTATQSVPVFATYSGACWYLK